MSNETLYAGSADEVVRHLMSERVTPDDLHTALINAFRRIGELEDTVEQMKARLSAINAPLEV